MIPHTFYAVDAPPVLSTVESVVKEFSTSPNLRWAALIDGAFDLPDTNTFTTTVEGINCFQNSGLAALKDGAPWLVPISGPLDVELLTKLIRHCRGRPMLSFVGTTEDLPALTEHWHPFHIVDVGDDQSMLLRFADTRVLAYLPTILRESQWDALTKRLSRWLYIDRTGTISECSIPKLQCTRETGIAIDPDQLALLIAASQSDGIITFITDTLPEIIPDGIRNSDLYKLVSRAHELANEFQIDNHSDIQSLAIAACLTNGRSNRLQETRSLLKARDWPGGSLGDLLIDRNIV